MVWRPDCGRYFDKRRIMIVTSNKDFPNPRWSRAILIVMVILVIAITLEFIIPSFSSSRPLSLFEISCIALCNGVVCGLISSYISKEGSFFFLGLLLGEIGIAIAIIMRANNKQKEGSKIQSNHQQPVENKYATLEHLDNLRKKNIITEKEFQAEKEKILNHEQI